MKKVILDVYKLLNEVRKNKPVIHHLTNWVTIYDCANIVKVMGASPVMAHAPEEVADMVGLASALVLNIGTLTVDFIESMIIGAKSANKKGIPVILDVCGAGATSLRDQKCFELLAEAKIDILKGNASEIARISGEDVKTRGVDAGKVEKDLIQVAKNLSQRRRCCVVITGKEDIVVEQESIYLVENGHPMMTNVVGTGCMATSAIGTFAAIEEDSAYACVAALVCFEIAAELAAKKSQGPGTFKEFLFDYIYNLDRKTSEKLQKVKIC